MCSWCVWTATGASFGVVYIFASTDFISVALGMVYLYLSLLYLLNTVFLLYYFTYNVKIPVS